VEQGYLERYPHPTDRRVLLVRLNAQGRAFTKVCWPIVEAVEAEVERVVGVARLASTRKALAAVVTAFEGLRS
jgi:DNA-binding MarR family transcriptional regulator